jgi:hypothetical protein
MTIKCHAGLDAKELNSFLDSVESHAKQVREQGEPFALQEEHDEYDVFLAHNWADKEHIRAIYQSLQQQKVAAWLDEHQIPPGRWFADVIQESVKRVRCAAVFFGPKGLGRWQRLELRAFIQRCVDEEFPLIPVLLPGVTDLPSDLLFLKQLNWVKFQTLDDAEAIRNLVWGITGKRPVSQI